MSKNFIAELAAVGALAPSADNQQPWRLSWNGTALEIGYADRHADFQAFSADSHATLLGIGAVAENLDMALDANGLRGEWQWASDARQPYGRVTIAAVPQAFRAPQGPARRHTNRLPFRRDPLPEQLLERIGALREGANRVTILIDRAQRERLVRLVRIASEARFCNHDLHQWLFGSLRRTPAEVASGDGLDIDSLGLPPGGKSMLDFISDWGRMSALNRLGAYKLLALSEVGLISAAPALLCISGPADRSVIDAGRLLTRVWTELNLAGIAVQPYYVVTDQLNRLHAGTLAPGFEAKIGAVEQELGRQLGLAQGEMLHMILRVGYPKADPVRSRRLPLAAVFTDSAG
jgi:nitroreductase